jgi:hypothetical protein
VASSLKSSRQGAVGFIDWLGGALVSIARAEAEGPHRFRVGVRLPCHEVTLDVPAKLIAEEISAFFPEALAARRRYEIHMRRWGQI